MGEQERGQPALRSHARRDRYIANKPPRQPSFLGAGERDRRWTDTFVARGPPSLGQQPCTGRSVLAKAAESAGGTGIVRGS